MSLSSPSAITGTDPLSRSEVRQIIFGLMMAMLLAALDQTIVATALPTIGRDLGDAEHLPWVVTAYLLSATSAVPIYGKLSDIHGRRIMLLMSISTFLVGSVLCALAPSMLVLVIARFVQGAGGGGLLALSQTIVGDILSPRERASYQPYFAMAFTVASLAGPVLGGFFAQHLNWSMIFWINVPLGFLAFLMTSAPLRRLPRHERPHRLDIWGAVLIVTLVTTLLLGLSWAAPTFGWLAPRTIGVFAVSVGLSALFSYHLRHTAEPLIPLELLSDKVVLMATVAATLSIGLFLGLAIYIPVLFETVRGLSASQSGLAMLPLTVGTVAGATLAGRAMAHFEHKRLPLAMMPIAAVAAIVLITGVGALPVWGVSLILAAISVALGTLLPISTVSIQNAVALHQLGTATATANLCRQLGGAVAVAIFGAILLGSGGNGAVSAVSAADEAALLRGFAIVFGLVAVGALAALVAIVKLEERPLTGPSRTMEETSSRGV